MWKLVWPILVVILSNTFYNICMKSMPGDVNPFGALMVTYLVAAIISGIIFVYMVGPSNMVEGISKINWTSVVLALAIVGLEVGICISCRMDSKYCFSSCKYRSCMCTFNSGILFV